MNEQDLLRSEAAAIRRAFQECRLDGDLSWITTSFPHACCGVVSSILSHHLFTIGMPDVKRASGVRIDQQSHMWVEAGEWIIDITADQFDEVSEPVLVTQNRTWHQQFSFDFEYLDAGFAGYSDEAIHASVYRAILLTEVMQSRALPTRRQCSQDTPVHGSTGLGSQS